MPTPSPAIAAEAKRIDAEKRKREEELILLLWLLLGQIKSNALAAHRLGHDPVDAVRQTLTGNARMPGIGPYLLPGMVGAYLGGRRALVRGAVSRGGLVPAVGRRLLEPPEVSRPTPGGPPAPTAPEVQRWATDWVRGATKTFIDNATRFFGRELAKQSKGRPDGPTDADIKTALANTGIVRPTQASPNADFGVVRIIEDTIAAGTERGYRDAGREPEIAAETVARIWCTRRDNRVRPKHKLLEGVTRPPGDPFWKKYVPPIDWNCRCFVLDVYKGDTYQFTSIPTGVEPGDGWAYGKAPWMV